MGKKPSQGSRTVALIATAIVVGCFTVLMPATARADTIIITSGFYAFNTPFRNQPSYINFTSDLRGNNFRAFTHVLDGGPQQLGSNCIFPCTAGSTFSLSAFRPIAQLTPTGVLEIDGESHFGFFAGSGAQFDTGTITIPLDAGSELTLSTSFTMSGTIDFQEYDLQQPAFTGFTFSSDIVGSGIADISLFFSNTSGQYEVAGVRYNFQPDPVPEPGTVMLLVTGLAGLAARSYKRHRRI